MVRGCQGHDVGGKFKRWTWPEVLCAVRRHCLSCEVTRCLRERAVGSPRNQIEDQFADAPHENGHLDNGVPRPSLTWCCEAGTVDGMKATDLVEIIKEIDGELRIWTASEKLVIVTAGDGSQCAFLDDSSNRGSWAGAARASDDREFLLPIVDDRSAVEKVLHAMVRDGPAGVLIPSGPVTGKKQP